MSQDTDTSNAAVRPPVAWLLALAAAVAADQLYPLRFVPASVPGAWVGGAIFAIAFDSLWIVVTLVPFYFVIRYGVVAREEAYLERKFGDVYRGYKSRVRRWL